MVTRGPRKLLFPNAEHFQPRDSFIHLFSPSPVRFTLAIAADGLRNCGRMYASPCCRSGMFSG